MARVTVKLLAVLEGELVRETGEFEASDAGGLLEELSRRYGKRFSDEIYSAGRIMNFYVVLHEGQPVDRQAPGKVALKDGGTVHIFPAVSGG